MSYVTPYLCTSLNLNPAKYKVLGKSQIVTEKILKYGILASKKYGMILLYP